MVLGQTMVAGSVVQGEKLRFWVKRWWREVWSREQNRAPGSSPAPPECGPRREIMVLGQALVAGSVVQGAKPCPRVKPSPAVVWSREQNRGPRVTPCPARAWSSHLKYKKESKTNI